MNKTLFLTCMMFLATGLDTPILSKPLTPVETLTASELTQNLPHNSSDTNNEFQLIDAGSEPRQELRFIPSVPSQEIGKMTMNTGVKLSIGDQAIPQVNSPATEITMVVTVDKIDSNGDIYSNFVYNDINVVPDSNIPPELVNIFRSQMNQLIGLNGSWVMDNRGKVKDIQLGLPSSLDANSQQILKQFQDSLTQISSPLPAEAVGIGAKWQVTNVLNINDVDMTQVATYKLVSRKDDIIILEVKVEQQADSQTMSIPGLPPNASVNVISLDGEGGGRVEMRLDKIMPIRANISMSSSIKMEVEDDRIAEKQIMTTDSTTQIYLESR